MLKELYFAENEFNVRYVTIDQTEEHKDTTILNISIYHFGSEEPETILFECEDGSGQNTEELINEFLQQEDEHILYEIHECAWWD